MAKLKLEHSKRMDNNCHTERKLKLFFTKALTPANMLKPVTLTEL